MRVAFVFIVATYVIGVGCAPPPIYTPTPHPVVAMDDSGVAATMQLQPSGLLTGSVLVRAPYGLFAYGLLESEDGNDTAFRRHWGRYVGGGLSYALPLSSAVRTWVELGGGYGSGESETQGTVELSRDGDRFVNESGSFTTRYWTGALVFEQGDPDGFRSQFGFTTRLAYLDYDLDVLSRDPELAGLPLAGWIVEPGVLLGLGSDFIQARWRQVWVRPIDDLGFTRRSGRATFEVALRVPFEVLW
ncbi:MAG: hypothetical protein AAFU38_14625 [Bacteroidota bacterium]